jgi:hypothetical protein
VTCTWVLRTFKWVRLLSFSSFSSRFILCFVFERSWSLTSGKRPSVLISMLSSVAKASSVVLLTYHNHFFLPYSDFPFDAAYNPAVGRVTVPP